MIRWAWTSKTFWVPLLFFVVPLGGHSNRKASVMPADITSALWGCATWPGSSRLRIFWAYPHFTRTAQQVRIFLTTLKTRSLWRLRCLSRVNVRGLRLCSSFTMRHHSMKNAMLPSASFLASWTRSNHQQKNRPFQLSFPIHMYTRYVWRVILVFDPFQMRTFDPKEKNVWLTFRRQNWSYPERSITRSGSR